MPKGTSDVKVTRKVEVFRPGTFRAMNGQEYAFSEADVAGMVANYDSKAAPAPVVVGHPKHDDPAFGWADSFEVNEAGTLVADLTDLSPEFVSAVEEGRYRKVSMKFFAPDASNNPKPGTYYPRHIGFLGGAAPAVSGLATVQFAEAEDDELIEIAFVEPAMEDVATLFRRMREFFIEKFSLEDADKAVPEYLIRWVDDAADAPSETAPAFTAPKTEEPAMAADETKLNEREANISKRERAQRNTENVSFAEELIAGGKMLPVQKDSVVALLNELGVDEASEIAFSDDGTEKKVGAVQLLKDILSAQPEVVPGGATDLGSDVPSASPAFAAPDGMSVDTDGLELHQKAVAFQAQHPGTQYIAAVQAVQGA
mgnify:CR=1 FL=1